MEKDFDTWNHIKKQTDLQNPVFKNFPKRGEVWVVILGKNIGFEQNGVGEDFIRPVVVVTKINNQMFWCVPLSSKQKPLHFYINFLDPDNQQVAAITGQLRLVSIKRFQRKMYELSWDLFDTIKNNLKQLLG